MARIYFASDLHLGVDARLPSGERERLFVRWLDEVVAPDADGLYLLGDIFEFWFEYRHVVPRGYVRLLGKLAELVDAGVDVQYYVGNHDLWMGDYFPTELGIPLHREPQLLRLDNRQFLVGHGDGLGPGDLRYKRLKRVFTNATAQWLYARLHPNFAIAAAHRVSRASRTRTGSSEDRFFGVNQEWIACYCEEQLAKNPDIDYFIFGHRHLPIDLCLSNGYSRYLNTGDWLNYQTYACWDGQQIQLHAFGRDLIVYPK